jgi:hypothetical protein
MDNQLLIPSKIKVGFQNRGGTYTGKLAYVIYYDLKGKLRKEKSWQTWRDKKIAPVEFDNVPTDGFVLNKGVGGQRHSYGWNARNEYIRVYDPRDFEFEISVANLLFILRECDCNKGKGLEGKFVYAWDGTELVLLPEISTDYQNSKKWTQLQTCGVKSKDLILGASYTTKKQEVLTYLGRFDYHYIDSDKYWRKNSIKNAVQKQYVFWDGKRFVFMDTPKAIAVLNSDAVTGDYAELVEKYNKSIYGSKIVKIFTKPGVFKPKKNSWDHDPWVIENPDGTYTECHTNYDYATRSKIESVETSNEISFRNGVLEFIPCRRFAYANGHRRDYWDRRNDTMPWVEPTNHRLYALLESGTKARIANRGFVVKEVAEDEEDYDGEED